MLNLQDLAQLKIQALVKNQQNQYKSHYLIDLPQNLIAKSNDQIIIQNGSNGNILAFAFTILSNIFDNKNCVSQQNSSNGSPNSEFQSGRGSMSPQKNSLTHSIKAKQNQQICQGKQKLQKMLSFLFNHSVDFSRIKNIPINVEETLQLLSPQNYHRNMYLKKLMLQFFKNLIQQCQLQSDHGIKRPQPSKKQNTVFKHLKKYPIIQSIICIFFRCILAVQYEIAEAYDYNKTISDHTVFSALCDAFQCPNLHIEEKYTQLACGNFIQMLRIKKKMNREQNQDLCYYIVTLPNTKQQTLYPKQNGTGVTFRVRKKSSDISNNQSISFRQSSKAFQNKQQLPQFKNRQNIQSKNQYKIPAQIPSKKTQINRNMNQDFNKIKKLNNNPESSQTIIKIDNKNKQQNYNVKIFESNLVQQKFIPQHNYYNPSQTHNFQLNTQLNGYTSIDILKELNPQVRNSIVKTVNHFKDYNV